jgi:two-component system phosphate regulon sensor histidine kinase PhoR
MRRDFVANVSHEIRTPLTVLAGFVETLQTLSLQDAERRKYLGMMAAQADRMQSLVSDLLVLSKLESGPLPGLQASVDIHRMLLECQEEASQLSRLLSPGQAHQIAVVWPSLTAAIEGQARVTVAGAADELRSAVSNLLTNAVRYTPPGGRIQLAWTPQPDGSADISVRDSGAGIAAEHVPRLTERFYRVDRSRSRETGGTGLGLAIVKHVAQRHGGELRIDSTLGQGSCFTIHLPATRVRQTTAPAV